MKSGSNTMAAGKRMDLATLFCMVGRHGPAVALAAVAMLSLVAGYLIYRSVRRGKRREATDGDGDVQSGVEDSVASVIQPSPEECVASTDVSDEDSSDVRAEVDLIQSDPQIRHRRPAAAAAVVVEETPPTYSPPEREIQVPVTELTTSDDTGEMEVVWDHYTVPEPYVEEASQKPQGDTWLAWLWKKLVTGDARGATEDIVEDVTEEVYDNDGCLEEPEPVTEDNHWEEEKVMKAEFWEDVNRHDEETSYMSEENVIPLLQIAQQDQDLVQDAGVAGEVIEELVDERPLIELTDVKLDSHLLHFDKQDKGNKEQGENVLTSSVAPFLNLECFSTPVSLITHDGSMSGITSDSENVGISDLSDMSSDVQQPQQEDTVSQSPEEDRDFVILGPQMPSHDTQNQPVNNTDGAITKSTDEGKTFDDTKVISASEEPAFDDDSINSPIMSQEISPPDLLASSQEQHSDPKSEEYYCKDEQSVQTVNNEVFDSAGVAADPGIDENITSSVTVENFSCPPLPSVSQDQQSDHIENTETFDETRVSYGAEEPACDNASITSPIMSQEISHTDILASSQEEQSDPKSEEYYCKDEQSVQTVNKEVLENADVAADPGIDQNITTSVTVEDISHLPSVSQDQQSDHIENTETFDETRVRYGTEDPACDDASITSPIMVEEIFHADVWVSPQEQSDPKSDQYCCKDEQRVQTVNNEAFDNAGVAADPDIDQNITASVTVENVSCPHLPSVSQDKQCDNIENTEISDETTAISALEEHVGDIAASICLSVTPEEMSPSDTLASIQEQHIDQKANNEDIPEAAPVLTEIGISSMALTINEKVLDRECVAADPDTDVNIASSVTVEEALCPQMPSICQEQQSDHIENTESFVDTRVNSASEEATCDATCTSPLISEESNHPDMLASYQEQQSEQMASNEDFLEVIAEAAPVLTESGISSMAVTMDENICDKASVAADPDTDENVTASATVEDAPCPHLPSICQDEPAPPMISEEISHPELLASSQEQQSDQQNDQRENTEDFPEVTMGVAADVMTEDISPPMSQIHPLTFEQSEQSDNDFAVGVGRESGISSMAVSPDVSDAGNEFGIALENMTLSMMDCDVRPEAQTEAKSSLFSDDVYVSNGNTGGMVFGPYPPLHSLPPHHEPTDWKPFESVAGRDDVYGREIEDRYYREMDKFEAQLAAGVITFTAEPKSDVDVKAAVEVEKNDESEAGESVEKKEETKAENDRLMEFESFAANEDVFGQETEDSYYREMDKFEAQLSASATTFTPEPKTDAKAIVEVVKIDEKEDRESVEKKKETKAEKGEEVQYEKTEINIMEATMDHNEWIEDGSCQTLPWMNLSFPSFSQDHKQNNQLPSEECSATDAPPSTICTEATDISPSITCIEAPEISPCITSPEAPDISPPTTCIEATDISPSITCTEAPDLLPTTTLMDAPDNPPATEVQQTHPPSLANENPENAKKVVAVQPMPQNVNVTFRVHYVPLSPYQTLTVTGNLRELGNWKGFVPLESAKDGHWSMVLSLPAESHVEWKFVVLDKGEVCRWEECGNRHLNTGYGDDLLVHKWWGIL